MHKSGDEHSKSKRRKGQHQCLICKDYGHGWKGCKNADLDAKEANADVAKERRKKETSPKLQQGVVTVIFKQLKVLNHH